MSDNQHIDNPLPPDDESASAGTNLYECIYREFVDNEALKRGTYYERLAAIAAKILDDRDVVIHDIKLIGAETDVKHQIDVSIEKNGNRRRLLLECKDFSERSRTEPVGLGIVRDFFGVCDDVDPDEAAVLSATGFSREAKKYAAKKKYGGGKLIKLLNFRRFEEDGWDDRNLKVVLNFHFIFPKNPSATLFVDSKRLREAEREASALSGSYSTSFTITSTTLDQPTTMEALLKKGMRDVWPNENGYGGTIELPDDAVAHIDGREIPLKGITRTADYDHIDQEEIVGAKTVALLLIDLLEDPGRDRVIAADALQGWRVDPDSGEVVEREDAK